MRFATTLHQFLMDGKSNLRELNGYYKHFTVLVTVPGMYRTKLTYGHRIGAVSIGQVYPVVHKLLALFNKEGVGLVMAQAIVFPQTLRDINKVKKITDSKIEAVLQSGTHDLELVVMAAKNVSGEEDIMSIAPIPAYLVYNGFNHEISAALVYERP